VPAYEIKSTYDPYDHVIRVENSRLSMNAVGDDQATITKYDTMGNVIKVLSPKMITTGSYLDARRPYVEYNYDGFNRQITATQLLSAGSNTVSPTNLTMPAGAVTAVTSTTYDNLDRVTKVTNPDGYTRETAYDPINNAVSSKILVCKSGDTVCINGSNGLDANRQVTVKSAFDAAGRATKQIDARGNIKEEQYDLLGNITAQKDERNITTNVFQYTADGLLERVAEPNTRDTTTVNGWFAFNGTTPPTGYLITKRYVYGTRIFPTQQCVANQDITADLATAPCSSYLYDWAGRLTKSTLPTTTQVPVQTTDQSYDARGNRTLFKDADGFRSEYTYDTFDRLTRKWEPKRTGNTTDEAAFPSPILGLETRYAYDIANNLITKTDHGLVTDYTYNTLGSVVTESRAHKVGVATTTMKRAYRLDGELTAQNTFDEAGTLFQNPVNFETGAIQTPTTGNISGYAISPAGKRTKEWSAGNGITEKSEDDYYNGLGMRVKRVFTGSDTIYAKYGTGAGSPQTTTYWTYDQNANLREYLKTSLEGNETFAYTYTETNKEESNLRNVTVQTVSVRDPNTLIHLGQSISPVSSGLVRSSYNERNMLNLTTVNETLEGTSPTTSVITDYKYWHDGNKKAVANGTRTYEYDTRGRPIKETDANGFKEGNSAATTTTITYAADGMKSQDLNLNNYGQATKPTIGGLIAVTLSNQAPNATSAACLPGNNVSNCGINTFREYDANGMPKVIKSINALQYSTGNKFVTTTYVDFVNDDFGNQPQQFTTKYETTTPVGGTDTTVPFSRRQTKQVTFNGLNQITAEALTDFTSGAVTNRNYTLDSKGRRLSMSGNDTANIYNNAQKRYDTDDRAAIFNQPSTSSGFCGVTPQRYWADRHESYFRYDPFGREILTLSANIREHNTAPGPYAYVTTKALSTATVDGNVQTITSQNHAFGATASGCDLFFPVLTPQPETFVNKIKDETFSLADDAFTGSDWNIFQPFNFKTPSTSVALEAPQAAFSTQVGINVLDITTPDGATPNPGANSSDINTPITPTQAATSPSTPAASTPAVTGSSNGAISPFGVSSYSLGTPVTPAQPTAQPTTNQAGKPSANDANSNQFGINYDLSAPESVLPISIAAQSASSINAPQDATGTTIPSAGSSVTEIGAPGAVNPPGATTAADGIGGITAPNTNATPTVTPVIGNPVSSVQAPIGTVGNPNVTPTDIGALSIERGDEDNSIDTAGSIDSKSSEIDHSTSVSTGDSVSNFNPDAQIETTNEQGAATYGGDTAQTSFNNVETGMHDPSNGPSAPSEPTKIINNFEHHSNQEGNTGTPIQLMITPNTEKAVSLGMNHHHPTQLRSRFLNQLTVVAMTIPTALLSFPM
jgi:YD repeat-containing protein